MRQLAAQKKMEKEILTRWLLLQAFLVLISLAFALARFDKRWCILGGRESGAPLSFQLFPFLFIFLLLLEYPYGHPLRLCGESAASRKSQHCPVVPSSSVRV